MIATLARVSLLVLASLPAVAPTAWADAVADFYKGKTISVVVPVAAGGVYSTFAQILERHLSRHIPGNPNMIVQHMPGAGGVNGANYLYNAAPKDGTFIATFNSGLVAFAVLNAEKVKFDPLKFHWFAAWGEAVTVLTVLSTAPAKTIQEAMQKEVVMGAIGKSTNTYQLPAMLNDYLGTKFKIITGYTGGGPIRLAMEKGEVDGFAGLWESWKVVKPDWIRGGKLAHLVQLATKRLAPDLANVPTLMELAKTEEQKQIFAFMTAGGVTARAVQMPPGVPADRVAAIRRAIDATYADKAFLEEATKHKFDIDPVSAEATYETVKQQVNLPKELVGKMRQIMGFE
jgi:tripartite-type tricarboxylate transporter receptor subunit TctC